MTHPHRDADHLRAEQREITAAWAPVVWIVLGVVVGLLGLLLPAVSK